MPAVLLQAQRFPTRTPHLRCQLSSSRLRSPPLGLLTLGGSCPPSGSDVPHSDSSHYWPSVLPQAQMSPIRTPHPRGQLSSLRLRCPPLGLLTLGGSCPTSGSNFPPFGILTLGASCPPSGSEVPLSDSSPYWPTVFPRAQMSPTRTPHLRGELSPLRLKFPPIRTPHPRGQLSSLRLRCAPLGLLTLGASYPLDSNYPLS